LLKFASTPKVALSVVTPMVSWIAGLQISACRLVLIHASAFDRHSLGALQQGMMTASRSREKVAPRCSKTRQIKESLML
jgi:hypothetical protein